MNTPKYSPPLDALVADVINRLDTNLREEFEERAGIIEYDGQLPRAHAECLALLDVLCRHPNVLTGVAALQVERGETTEWLLTADLGIARQHLAAVGGIEIGILDPADVLREQYGGMAWLATPG